MGNDLEVVIVSDVVQKFRTLLGLFDEKSNLQGSRAWCVSRNRSSVHALFDPWCADWGLNKSYWAGQCSGSYCSWNTSPGMQCLVVKAGCSDCHIHIASTEEWWQFKKSACQTENHEAHGHCDCLSVVTFPLCTTSLYLWLVNKVAIFLTGRAKQCFGFFMWMHRVGIWTYISVERHLPNSTSN